MDCPVIAELLIPYHFATCSEDERQSVDEHLLTCTDCLRTYLALKHQFERTSARAADKPSENARLRLRADVEAMFRPSVQKRMGAWLARPVPFYQSFAVAAVALVLVAIGMSVSSRVAVIGHGEYVDTSRPVAQSRTVY